MNTEDMPLAVVDAIQTAHVRTTYHGVPALKNPMDAWTYQELVWRVRPTAIVEIGTHQGGGSILLADLLASTFFADDVDVKYVVVTVDVDHQHVHPSVTEREDIIFFTGDGAASAESVRRYLSGPDFRSPGPVLVIEDSSHYAAQTLGVLEAYAPLVTPGSYLICEDTVCGHPLVFPDPGPWSAVEQFLAKHPEFERDRSVEFPLSWNPGGFLRKKG